MRKNNGTFVMETSHSLLRTSPSDVHNWKLALGFFARHTLPTFRFHGGIGAELLSFPHNNVTILGTARYNSSSSVVLDRDDLVIDNLALKGGIGK